MASSGHLKATTTLPRVRQRLPPLYPGLQLDSGAPHEPHLHTPHVRLNQQSASSLRPIKEAIHLGASSGSSGPDQKQIVVEVNASETGVGAVLSQRSDGDDKMHP